MSRPSILKIFGAVKPYSGTNETISKKRHELEQTLSVIRQLNDYTDNVRILIEQCSGLKIASDFNLRNADIVAKNISWLTSISILKLDHMKFTIDEEDPTTYEELIGNTQYISKKISPFQKLYSAGIVVPIPTTIEQYDGAHNFSNTFDLGKNILDVGFSNQFVKQQLTGKQPSTFRHAVLELKLPRVAHIPEGEILSIRTDNNELFMHLQDELVKFINKSNETDSEEKLKNLLLHIDDEIHRLTKEFEKIDQKRRLEQLGLAYSFGVMSLVLILPSEIYKSFAALLGSTNILNTIRNIRLLDLEKRQLLDDPFYIPYKLSKMAEQYDKR